MYATRLDFVHKLRTELQASGFHASSHFAPSAGLGTLTCTSLRYKNMTGFLHINTNKASVQCIVTGAFTSSVPVTMRFTLQNVTDDTYNGIVAAMWAAFSKFAVDPPQLTLEESTRILVAELRASPEASKLYDALIKDIEGLLPPLST